MPVELAAIQDNILTRSLKLKNIFAPRTPPRPASSEDFSPQTTAPQSFNLQPATLESQSVTVSASTSVSATPIVGKQLEVNKQAAVVKQAELAKQDEGAKQANNVTVQRVVG